MSKKIENGKVEVMGVNIDISQVLGEKIIDQYIGSLSDDDINNIIKYISEDLFVKDIFSDKLLIVKRQKDQWGNYKEKELPIGELIKNQFNARIKEELCKKIEEIISSSDYQDRIDEIAQELVDYSVEGYKEDMKERIKERLVNNTLDPTPGYCGISLMTIINNEIDKRIHR